MIQAAKLSSANEITAIIPYFGYGRQDRKDQPRVPISGAWTAQKLAFAGADRLCTIDIHNEAMEGVVLNVPWDNLFASYTFVPVIRKLKLPNLMIATPDAGGVKRAIKYSELLGLGKNVAVASKYRDPNVKDVSKIIGLDADIKGKDIVIVDDIINTGITLNEPARIMKRMGARSIRAFVTHGLLVGNAKELLNKSDLDEIYITDTVPVPEWIKQSPKIKVISVAPLLAGAIERIETGESISDRFILQLHLGKKH
jgi:ribose-phosphate pyrophosphokinase